MANLTIEDQNLIISKLNSPENKGGIIELKLSFWERLAEFKALLLGKEYINKYVKKLKTVISNQPSFFISRDSWQLLMEGKVIKPDGSIWNWVLEKYPNYEVFSFVFCVCEFTGVERLDPPVLYFRIRTILKLKNNIISKQPQIVIDSENIAFANLSNLFNTRKDSLTFIEEEKNKAKLADIDSDVIKVVPGLNSSNPTALALGKILNNGNYFSKDRIKVILQENPNALGSKISIGADDYGFKFLFKINPEYETSLPCPVPVVC